MPLFSYTPPFSTDSCQSGRAAALARMTTHAHAEPPRRPTLTWRRFPGRVASVNSRGRASRLVAALSSALLRRCIMLRGLHRVLPALVAASWLAASDARAEGRPTDDYLDETRASWER